MARPKTQREPIHSPIHEPIHAPLRESFSKPPPGRAVALNRQGQEVWIRDTGHSDPFFVPPEIIPEGWTYEWKRILTYNQPDDTHMAELARNGWEPVPNSRHPGLFMSADKEGPIVVRDLGLYERSEILTRDAIRMRQERANDPLRTIHAQLGAPTAQMPDAVRRSQDGKVVSQFRTQVEQFESEPPEYVRR